MSDSHPRTAADRHHDLARQMVLILPAFGRWAGTIREFETPYGKAGIRQLEVLYLLRHGLISADDSSATELSRYLQIQRSVVTRILVKLENGGYIVRSVDPRDGRAQRITITARGRQLSDFVEQQFFDEMEHALGALTEVDLDHLEHSMNIMARVATKLRGRDLSQRLPERIHGS